MKFFKVAVSLAALTFGANAYADTDVNKDSLWAIQQVAAICSAHDIGEMADDFWDVVKDIDELLGEGYEPHPTTRSQSTKYVMRAATDTAICYQSYPRVVNHLNEYKESV